MILKIGKGLASVSVIVVIVSGCALVGTSGNSIGGESDGGAPLPYLQEEVPVCEPVSGSDRDPCAVIEVPNLPTLSDPEYLKVPNYWDLYYDAGDPPSVVIPHLVIRASFLPDTTRCDLYERKLPAFVGFDFRDEVLMCFVDARVNEYVVGTGPPTLTVVAYSLGVGAGSVFDYQLFRVSTAEAFEGREGVMFLAPSPTTVVEVWWMLSFWDVQRTGGKVTVVAPYKDYFEWRSRFTDEDRALLERPLSDFESVIREGAVARATATLGRIAVGEDLPMLITNANMLRPYFEGPGVGVSYETDTPAKPPPVPGGEDPEHPPGQG